MFIFACMHIKTPGKYAWENRYMVTCGGPGLLGKDGRRWWGARCNAKYFIFSGPSTMYI